MTIVSARRISMMTTDIGCLQEEAVMGKHEGKESFLKHSTLFLDNARRRNSRRFVAALVAALSSLVAGLTPALASAPQIHDQAPGFFRLKVGDLEVTALYDAAAVFELPWLKG